MYEWRVGFKPDFPGTGPSYKEFESLEDCEQHIAQNDLGFAAWWIEYFDEGWLRHE